jgi:dTDP-glucose 4,6-dehydratase
VSGFQRHKIMKNILVTGGAGFIGSNFIYFLLEKDLKVKLVNLDLLTYAGNLENLKDLPDVGRYEFVYGNICDQALVEKILREHDIDIVVHFAAESHVDRSITGPKAFIETNINGTFSLLESVRKIWLLEQKGDDKHFHHISTDEVFGSLSPTDPAFSESTPYFPNSPYAASKASSDHLVRSYAHTYGLPITITNCSNNYGPYQFPEKLIPLIIMNAVNGKSLPIYGDGQQVRDWLYVEDHCAAIWNVIQKGKNGESYNIGGGNQPTNLKIVTTICQLLDDMIPESPYCPHNQLIKFITDRPGHDRRYAMDIRKIQAELGWSPQYTLIEGLKKTVNWYLEHKEWTFSIQEQKDYKNWVSQNYKTRGTK